ncbi:MAG: hypothetical protein H7Z72_26790, partial [Bacteroidetes bacterium]|nr:hypothetical protein [Fibrella sp.]
MKPLRICTCLLLLGWSQYAVPARADGSVPRPTANRTHWVINQTANQLDAGRYDSAQFYLNQGARLVSQRADAESAFYLSAYQSEVFYHNALFEQGIQYALRGLHQAEGLRDSTMMANQHNLLGLFYTDLGQLAKAIAHLQRSIHLLPKRPASRYGLTNRYHILSNLGQ